MSRQVLELETLLQELIAENGRLLKHLEVQHTAMKALDAGAMDAAARLAEGSRMRLLALDTRRRRCVQEILTQNGKRGTATVTEIAALNPSRSPSLMKLRDELKDVLLRVTARSQIAGKVAASLLGHLNTVVRLIAGAVEKAGLYTKYGVPKVSSRVGVMEAVG